MKIVVAHTSPDWDAIGAIWLVKKFLPGWQEAQVEFVPAGLRKKGYEDTTVAIEQKGDDEVIHVDTGMGPLDHHQTSDQKICATTRAWDFVQEAITSSREKLTSEHLEVHQRIVNIILAVDHFKEVFWAEPTADYHEFSLLGILEGLKIKNPDNDLLYTNFGIECLEALVHEFENRIWAEREINSKGIRFTTRFGQGIAFETINDTVLKLSQKMGYMLVVRKDPRKGYVRIKVRPTAPDEKDIDLTLAYEKLRKIDPDATWFLHVSKKMLLNGTPKNPKMIPTKLSLKEIVGVLESM